MRFCLHPPAAQIRFPETRALDPIGGCGVAEPMRVEEGHAPLPGVGPLLQPGRALGLGAARVEQVRLHVDRPGIRGVDGQRLGDRSGGLVELGAGTRGKN
jgi:hypothetical protein